VSHPLLYEINTRCWLRDLSEKLGHSVTLDVVPETELASWEGLGFTHIWMMGVWSGGPRARAQALQDHRQHAAYAQALPDWREEDVAASPYAVAEYRVSAALGGDEGLREFRRRLNARGIKLVLDFVPNHVGLDSPWLWAQPELFVHGQPNAVGVFSQATTAGPQWLAHGKDPYFPAWSDTVQLDYRRPATRTTMIEVLKTISTRCDGIRCDMAMLLINEVFARTWPNSPSAGPMQTDEFWSTAIAATKASQPDFLFLAEAYWGLEPRLQALGFDYTYDKTLYDLLLSCEGSAALHHLVSMPSRSLASGAHFLENHDEPRIAASLPWAGHRAAALIVLGLPGMRLLHEGQLTGARLRTPVQLARRSIEPIDCEIHAGYTNLLSALKSSTVGKGKGGLLPPRPAWSDNPTAQNFVLVQWQTEGAGFDLVVVNFAPHRGQCFAPVELPNPPGKDWLVRDLLSNESYLRSGEDLRDRGLYLDAAPFAAHLFNFQPAD